MRLQKYLAEAGIASRRKCEELIQQGRVFVNGKMAAIGMSVEPGVDKVVFDGKKVEPKKENVVIAFYKPRGVISAASDPRGRKTVTEYFKELPYRLYNVGRLDINSEGLLLMTNDGELAHRLMHPGFHVQKTYQVTCSGVLTEEERRMLMTGVMLEDGMTAPAAVKSVKYNADGTKTTFLIAIREGRNRQVRRMVEAVGHETLRLKRISMGPVVLGELHPGEWRYLTAQELEALLRAAKL